MKFIGIIPARFESSRFPGKPLAMIKNKPMIQWVLENAWQALEHVWVATDDKRIENAVLGFGGNVVMTSKQHRSGTDRCAEAANIIRKKTDFDVVINIQGDEPFIQKDQIDLLKSCFKEDAEIATLIRKIKSEDELFNPNRPKVVINKNKNALYFSRSPIPYVREEIQEHWLLKTDFWAHIGMYAYKTEILQQITTLPPGILEKIESLEQLRWIENGYKIKTAETRHENIGIDTPEDLELAIKSINEPNINS